MLDRLFGPAGLRVSELFLGAMTFGEQGGVGAPPAECAREATWYRRGEWAGPVPWGPS
jgi:aryl-alcohol dehydrogenase-like predicted oxidoreductase